MTTSSCFASLGHRGCLHLHRSSQKGEAIPGRQWGKGLRPLPAAAFVTFSSGFSLLHFLDFFSEVSALLGLLASHLDTKKSTLQISVPAHHMLCVRNGTVFIQSGQVMLSSLLLAIDDRVGLGGFKLCFLRGTWASQFFLV